MGTGQVRIEVTLAGRTNSDSRVVDVIKAWQERGDKWLNVIAPHYTGGIAMITVSLTDYIIQDITLYDDQYTSGYTEPYGPNEHDQIQAFEALECICEEEEVVSSIGQVKEKVEDEKLSGLAGPKRIEITLRQLGRAVEKKLVVTDVMPPSGHYSSYSVAGREWKGKTLENTISTLWSSSNWLARIDAYLPGGQGSASDHFTPQNQEQAWASLEKMFYKFKPAELTVLKNWTLDDDDDPIMDIYGGEWYGPTHRSQHWTNKSPSHYAPPQSAHFRVAGDEVGAVIHIEQQKTWEEEGSPDPEQSLKEMLEAKEDEKKADAGTVSTASGSGKAANDPQTSDDRCGECGGNDCPSAFCVEDAYGVGVSGGIPIDGSYTVH